MPQTEITPIQFKNNDGAQTNAAELHIIHYNQSDCVKRALMKLGLFWLLSLGSIPIIIAHWVLVPGFFIAGPIMAVIAYKTKFAVDHASGVCPTCDQTITVKMEPKDVLPKWTYCPDCNNSLHLDNAGLKN